MISVLKIMLKTNIDGHIVYEPYILTNSSNTIDVNFDKLRIPKNTILMSDLVPLEPKYFPEKRVDYLNSVTQTDLFVKILSTKLNDYKKKERKEFKTTTEQAAKDEVAHYNINNIIQSIFKRENPFFYGKDRTLTVMNHYWNGGYNISVDKVANTDFRLYEVHVVLELDLRAPDKINADEFKKATCKTQREKIKRIWSYLRNVEYVPPKAKVVSLPKAPALQTNNISV